MRLVCGVLALLFLLLPVAAHAQTRQSPVPLPVPFNPIVDNANVIDASTRARLEAIFINLKERANIEYAVLTVPTTGDQDIFDFSLAVARGWGIGAKDGEKAGLLLVVAIDDRKYFTQVSDHLEGDLPDGLVGIIQRERLVPAFRQKQYSEGIFNTIQAYIATLGQKRGFSVEGIDQRFAYRGEQPEQNIEIRRGSRSGLSVTCCGVLVVVGLLVVVLLGSRGGPRGGRRGGGWGGGGGGWLTALLLGNLVSGLSSGGRSSSSGWGGGFGGGGFGGGGGGGGFGGGFGGGGSFGGGGAGGSW